MPLVSETMILFFQLLCFCEIDQLKLSQRLCQWKVTFRDYGKHEGEDCSRRYQKRKGGSYQGENSLPPN